MIIRLLLFFYFTSAYLGATHIHHDALDSLECKVHVLVKNLNSGDTLDSSFELLLCEGCFESILFNHDYFVQPLIKGFDSQAPPYLF